MSSHVLLHHHTRYHYDRPVCLGPQTIRLRPVAAAQQFIQTYALRIAPPYTAQTWHHDAYGNEVARVEFAEHVTFFDITMDLQADLTPRNPFSFKIRPEALHWVTPTLHGPKTLKQPFYASPQTIPEELLPVYFDARYAEAKCVGFLKKWLPTAPAETLAMLVALNKTVAERVRYQVRLEPGVWSPEETLTRQSGSCRDSAWLLVALLRRMGFAARFVSGYLVQSSHCANGNENLTCDLHAWAETYLPGAGWVGFDTTSGLLTAQAHVPLAATPNPEEAAPVSGLLDHCQATFDVKMKAQRLFVEAEP